MTHLLNKVLYERRSFGGGKQHVCVHRFELVDVDKIQQRNQNMRRHPRRRQNLECALLLYFQQKRGGTATGVELVSKKNVE